MGYKVKLNIFEGPFDLLVYLIENAQMSIYDIKISEITKQYLGYIEQMKKMEVAVATEFMVLAAALIEIKSKMLLPRSVPQGEEIIDEDPRSELVTKLLEYKKFKMLAEMLEQQERENERIFQKPREDISVYTNEPDEYLDLELNQFVNAFNLFLQKKQRMEEMERNYARVEKRRITTEEKVAFIREFIKKNPKAAVEFHQLLKPESDKYDVALTFVSMLELVRQKRIDAKQEYAFGEITLIPTERIDENPDEQRHQNEQNH